MSININVSSDSDEEMSHHSSEELSQSPPDLELNEILSIWTQIKKTELLKKKEICVYIYLKMITEQSFFKDNLMKSWVRNSTCLS